MVLFLYPNASLIQIHSVTFDTHSKYTIESKSDKNDIIYKYIFFCDGNRDTMNHSNETLEVYIYIYGAFLVGQAIWYWDPGATQGVL